jgi:phage terminase large subunit
VYRELKASNLIVSEAADAIRYNTGIGEKIAVTFAPPDMWTTLKDTGKTMAEVFMLNGINIVKSSNNRVQGHLQIKEMLAPMPEKDKPPEEWRPGLLIFNNCENLINDLQVIQSDEKNPNDCAKQPHDITHTVDGLRYYCISRVLAAEESAPVVEEPEDEDAGEDYDEFMHGGEATSSYINYNGGR